MRRFKWLLLSLSVLLLATAAGLFWLLGTASGARTLMAAASRLTPVEIRAAEVLGRVAGELRLQEVVVEWPSGQGRIGSLHLDWRPGRLVRGDLAVTELSLRGVEIELEPREEPPSEPHGRRGDLSLPRLNLLPFGLEGEIVRLHLEDVVLRRPGEEPVRLNEASARLVWSDETLTVADLRAAGPPGKLAAAGRIDFAAPGVRLDLTAELTDPAAGFTRMDASADLTPAPGRRRLTGPVQVKTAGGKERLQVEADLDWSAERLAVESLRLIRPDGRGELRGSIEVTDPGEWRLAVDLTADHLDLRPWLDTPTDLSGRLAAGGTLADYRGRLELANEGEGWRRVRLDTPFSGGRDSLVLPALEANWLDGRLQGRLSASWAETREVAFELEAEGLNPARVTPGWPGRINVQMQGAVVVPPAGEPVRAQIDARLRDSTLRGRALTGRLRATATGEDLQIAELVLHGDGFDLTAGGRLRERIDFRADIPRLAGLIPDAAGSLQAGGWIRWRDGEPSGEVTARGNDIDVGPVRAGVFDLQAERRTAEEPFRVAADLQSFAFRDWRLTKAALRATGTAERHRFRLNAEGPDLRLQAAAGGGYEDGRWSGTLTELAGGGRDFGQWTLEKPTALAVSAKSFRIAPFTLAGSAGEHLAAAADLAFEPLRGRLEGDWQRLDLALANPWLKQAALDGRTSGSAEVRWLPGGRLTLQGKIEAVGNVTLPEGRIGIRRAAAEIAWNEKGLKSAWRLTLADGGELEGEAASGAPGRPGLPPHGEAQAQWRDVELALLSPWVPGLSIDGKSSGTLRGRWAEEGPPDLEGDLELAGRVAWRELDLRVQRAEASFLWRDEGLQGDWDLRLADGGAMSGHFAAAGPARPGLPEEGEVAAEWQGLDLALFSPFWTEGEVSGTSGGRLQGRWRPDRSLDLVGRVDLAGRIAYREGVLEIRRGEAEIHWGGDGLRSRFDLGVGRDGRLAGTVASEQPGRLEVPERGRVQAEWKEIDLALLRPWMPEEMLVEGALAGSLDGELLPERRLALSGEARVDGGELQWDSGEGVITAALRRSEMKWEWRGERLAGDLLLALEDYGQLQGSFALPLPARLPTEMQPEGPVRAEFTGSLQEKGLLTSLLPGLAVETSGRLSLDLRVGGTWRAPDLGGTAQLAEAGAYLPAAGIRLEGVSVRVRLAGEEVQIESFQVRSGPGQLEGEGTVFLENWRPVSYRAVVKGQSFRVINLPELQLLASPDLTLEGSRERLAVRGDIVLPEVLLRGRETEAPITPSPDVIIVDAPERLERQSPLALDIRVRIVLGEHVLVRAEGIDARLEGSLRLHAKGLEADEITAQGEIRVAQGSYSTYGVRLQIVRGTILFAGGPVDRPTLDILALRTVGEVKAGVRITGFARQPEVQLYSEPTMPDTEILSYVVLGHPLGEGGGNVGLLMTAAGALLSKGESAVLQDRLARTFGLDVLEIEAGSGDVTGSQITIGKYLSPSLYISFGQSLFTNANEVRLRYDISRKWQLESSVGETSAVDLFFKIEFR